MSDRADAERMREALERVRRIVERGGSLYTDVRRIVWGALDLDQHDQKAS